MSSPYPRPIGDEESIGRGENETSTSFRQTLSRLLNGGRDERRSLRRKEDDNEDSTERLPVPTVLPSPDVYSTPLPTLSIIVLSITMLGEFLLANVSTPFLLFMVKDFGVLADDAEVAFWTGILVSAFFLTQFAASLLWATVANKYGCRMVLVVCLLGGSITCTVFGLCKNIEQALTVRLLQGIFGGAIGVARGTVASITDESNSGRAYAILGFCWGFGGVAGAIVGGFFESPATKWPGAFGSESVFASYPYLLPCAVAAFITSVGSILACFLDRDGGPAKTVALSEPEKNGEIPSPIPEEESLAASPNADDEAFPRTFTGESLSKTLTQKLSGYLSARGQDTVDTTAPKPGPSASAALPILRSNTFSKASRTAGYGTFTSRYGQSFGARRGSTTSSVLPSSNVRRRRDSDASLAHRMVMANENTVNNIADLWVAAAMNADNEDGDQTDDDLSDDDSIDASRGRRYSRSNTASPFSRRSISQQNAGGTPTVRPVPLGASPHPQTRLLRQESLAPSVDTVSRGMPSIYANTGVESSPAPAAPSMLFRSDTLMSNNDALTTILEARKSQVEVEQPPSMWSQLPGMIILQYGLLALHTTTHDQLFMSYLVTDYDSGGLNLSAGGFAQIIAIMCIFQIAYQFYLYPNLGHVLLPPRGKLSHLAMFRLGSFLFIPSYLTVVLYRVPFASADSDGGFVLMIALAVSTAVRFCGVTFAFTSVAILLNYMSPPEAVGYANGVAQSIVSLARCFGPVLGGYLWSVSIDGNPSGYPLGFIAVGAVCAMAVLHSFLIR
ncbi:major facilitator superfamily domain-containing protein [Armillaria novae-zelandiae]|uniref:Major facilitator superfamily domain-containing protein n=1 Tax=Armillaria novae-zelandiae TaxID=153914 RepID=A0AA39PW49_9AGAR|nr:major facilitator superfamily domain-containing protein [Armillaria novae-zelandiae]